MKIFPLAYPLTADFSKTLSVVIVVVFLIVTPILAVVDTATQGFQTVSVFSSDWLFMPASQWYTRFLPAWARPKPGANCQPSTLKVGDNFRTSEMIHRWQITNIWAQPDPNNATAWIEQTSAFATYSGNNLSMCDVFRIGFTGNLDDETVTISMRIYCLLPLPIIATTEFTSSFFPDQETYLDYAADLVNADLSGPQSNVTAALQYLGLDLLNVMHATVQNLPGAPTYMTGDSLFHVCPLDGDSTSPLSCSPSVDSSPIPIFLENEAFITNTSEGKQVSADLGNATLVSPTYHNAVMNLIYAAHASARADIGGYRANNLFQNTQFISRVINSTATAGASGFPTQLLGAQSLLGQDTAVGVSFNGLPVPSSSFANQIQVQYLCQEQQWKAMGSRIMSIVVALLSQITTLYGLLIILSAMWHRHRVGHLANACQFHRSNTSSTLNDSTSTAVSKKHSYDSLPRLDHNLTIQRIA